jgi:hypothetical protein
METQSQVWNVLSYHVLLDSETNKAIPEQARQAPYFEG